MRKFTIYVLPFFVSLCLTGFALVSSAPLQAEEMPALTSAYFPIFPLGAGDEAVPELMPVTSNQALNADHRGVGRAIIIIPDYERDANANVKMITSLAGADSATTFILAPQFLLDTDIARLSPSLGEQAKMLARWPLDGWINGGESLNAPQKGVSSFTALDLLLLFLSEKKIFPDLQTVIIAGHGAGGDFVQRYAALGQAPDILDRQHIALRFLTANPSSYLYFTAPRFLITKPGGKPSLGTPDAEQCPSYNSYPYGLDDANAYVKRIGVSAIKLRYITRSVTYLIGANVAQDDALADTSCAAGLQGSSRVTRWAAYNMYLTVTFGEAVQKLQKFSMVPQVGYEPAALFGSFCGLAVLLGDGSCR